MAKLPSAVKFIINKSKVYSPIIIFTGNTQVGKSTVSKVLADIICQIKNKEDWDYKKYCAKTFDEFLELMDKYDDSLLVVEEAGFQLASVEWWSLQNKLFNRILQTQAYKHNILFIVLPYACGIAKAHRRMIDMLIWVKKKVTSPKPLSILYPVLIKKQYWKLDETDYKPRFFPIIRLRYNDVILAKAKEYTDNFLIDFKKEIMQRIKIEAGIIPEKIEEPAKIKLWR